MIKTPLGPVKLFVNDSEVEYKALRIFPDHRCPDVNARYVINYNYRKEYGIQRIRCCVPTLHIEGEIESGERLEAVTFYKNFAKLTIGIEASFGLEGEYGHDYSGEYLGNGIEYQTNLTTSNQIFQFGVCWIRPYTEDNDHQTWYGADPSLIRYK